MWVQTARWHFGEFVAAKVLEAGRGVTAGRPGAEWTIARRADS